jgi:hypothetical protein
MEGDINHGIFLIRLHLVIFYSSRMAYYSDRDCIGGKDKNKTKGKQ